MIKLIYFAATGRLASDRSDTRHSASTILLYTLHGSSVARHSPELSTCRLLGSPIDRLYILSFVGAACSRIECV